MQAKIECPSGLVGTVRGFKAKEANFLADRVAMKKGIAYDGILTGCWLETLDPGPYPWLKPGMPVDWQKALIADRFWALMRIRAATYGENYAFKVTCANGDCRQPINWELKLSDVPVKPLPAESRARMRSNDNVFDSAFDDGKAFTFQLTTGETEVTAGNIVRTQGTRIVVAGVASRILAIDGILPAQKLKYVGELDMEELLRRVAEFDEADGGVETAIDIECPRCSEQQVVQLPFDKDFFMPSQVKKATTGSTET